VHLLSGHEHRVLAWRDIGTARERPHCCGRVPVAGHCGCHRACKCLLLEEGETSSLSTAADADIQAVVCDDGLRAEENEVRRLPATDIRGVAGSDDLYPDVLCQLHLLKQENHHAVQRT